MIVGVGEVGYEKLFFILKSSFCVKVCMVVFWVFLEIEILLVGKEEYDVEIIWCFFEESDVEWFDLVIVVMNIELLN